MATLILEKTTVVLCYSLFIWTMNHAKLPKTLNKNIELEVAISNPLQLGRVQTAGGIVGGISRQKAKIWFFFVLFLYTPCALQQSQPDLIIDQI